MCRLLHKKVHQKMANCQPSEERVKEKSIKWRSFVVGAVAFFCYLNSLGGGLVFDDQPAIRDNKDLRPTTPITNLLYNDFWGTPMHREESHKSYRPLCVLTFRLNYLAHRLDSFGYHLINVLLHVVVCLIYHRLCSEILVTTPSLVAALLFAVHPIHSEAVTGVVGRAELLSAIFFLIALRTYMHSVDQNNGYNDYRALSRCLILSCLAMLSKEQGITVVAVCATYDILLVRKVKGTSLSPGRAPRGKVKGPTPTWRKDLVLRLLLMTLSTTAMLATRMRLMGNRRPVFNRFDNPAAGETWPVRHLTHHYLLSLNAWLLVFPFDLCCDWTMGTVRLVVSFSDMRTIPTVVFYTVICTLVWKGYYSSRRFSKRILMGVSLCVFPFLPASNLLYPVGFVVAERVLYIPSMGLCILIAHGFDNLCNKYRKQKCCLQICIVIIMCLYISKTIKRNYDWVDEETIFKSGLQVTKSNAKLYNNLGHVMESKGRIEDALQLFLKAAKVQPDDLGCHLNIGRMYNLLGLTEKAETAFRQAKELLPKVHPGKTYQTHIVPRHLDLFLSLGNLLSRNDSRLEEAQELYKEAISMKTDYIDAYIQRGNVLLKLNRSEEAHDMYKEALKHDHKNPDIFYNMGVLLLEQGKSHQALASFDQALQIDPQHEKSLLNYAILTQDAGDSSLRRLANERLHVLLDKGTQPERTYFNLGMLAMQDSNTEKAERYFRSALQLRGDFEAALFNLALVLYEGGRPLEAIPHLQRLRSSHTKGMLLLGNIYFAHLNNYTAALECYNFILKQEPAHVPALHNLCASLFQLGRLDEADSCLTRVRQLSPKDVHLIDHHLSLVRQQKEKLAPTSSKNSPSDPNRNYNLESKQKTGIAELAFLSGDTHTWR